MINRIKIEGFKSIKKLELELKPINILIGANGVGKSNFISFFKLVNNIYEQRLRQYSLKQGVDNLLHFGRKNTEQIYGHLSFHSQNGYSFNLVPANDGTLFIDNEKSIFVGGGSMPENVNYALDESNIKSSDSFRDKYLRKHLSSYKIYHFHDTSVSSSLRNSCNINDNRILKEDGSNLPAFLYYLKQQHPQNYIRIEKTVQSVVPDFEKFNLEPDKLDETRIRLVWNEINFLENYFDATNLSDGSLRFIAMATLLMQAELPEIIILDEPELGLHPFAINKLAAIIKSAAQKNCQIIVSSQSVNLINNFSQEDIITVDRKDNQSIFNRLENIDLNEWLADYSIGELWLKNVIEGQP